MRKDLRRASRKAARLGCPLVLPLLAPRTKRCVRDRVSHVLQVTETPSVSTLPSVSSLSTSPPYRRLPQLPRPHRVSFSHTHPTTSALSEYNCSICDKKVLQKVRLSCPSPSLRSWSSSSSVCRLVVPALTRRFLFWTKRRMPWTSRPLPRRVECLLRPQNLPPRRALPPPCPSSTPKAQLSSKLSSPPVDISLLLLFLPSYRCVLLCWMEGGPHKFYLPLAASREGLAASRAKSSSAVG